MSRFNSLTVTNNHRPVPTGDIRKLYGEAFGIYDKERKTPEIDVTFYPYVGINHTIRVRNGKVYVRIAEICSNMPLDAHRGLARILVAKLYGRRPPKQANEVYAEYIKTREVREKAVENKRTKGRKVITSALGAVYDLDETFNLLNLRYFHGSLPKPILTWSTRKTYRILGHHDAAHDTIVISRSLDSGTVPRFVVEYIVFHEMLHVAHPTKHVNGRRYNHTTAFKRDEQKFKYYTEAEAWIERNVRKLEKDAKRKTPGLKAREKKTLGQLVLPFFGRRK
jgi:hypothetical protein